MAARSSHDRASCRRAVESLQKVLLGGAWFVLQQKELSPYAQWRSCDERTRGRRRPSWAPTGIASTAWPFGSRNASDAEEVAQDALWAASRKIDTFRATSAFGSWVYRITANAAYQKLRKTGSQRHEVSWEDLVPSLDDFGQHGEVAIDWSRRLKDPAVEGELKRVLGRAIDELPAHYRTAFLLHDVDGLSNPEIAQTLQVKLAAIKSRVHRARLFLRRRLAGYVGAPRCGDDTEPSALYADTYSCVSCSFDA